MTDQDALQVSLINAAVVIAVTVFFLLYYLRRGLGPRRVKSRGSGRTILILSITAALALAAGTLVSLMLSR